MREQSSVILLEFNELCPSLMQQFMRAGKLPNFQKFYQEAAIYTTDAEEQPPTLEPWIQWVTVHSGLPYSEHQVFHLDQGHQCTHPRIWDRLSQLGYRVWVCGSMNPYYQKPFNGYFLPDYWSTQQSPYPGELAPFFKFVSRQVQEHTNRSAPLDLKAYGQFLIFMLKHGLSMRTVGAIVRQIFQEKQTGRLRWQRATILDKLQRDVFFWYYRRFKPHFSTFFLNSTAHFQHLYWRNLEPHRFQIQPTPAEQADYQNAILYGYQEMDKQLGDFLKLAKDGTTLMLCTALSQQPCLTYETIGGKHLYRPHRFEQLLQFAGVTSAYTCSPVMAEEFFIRFRTTSEAQVAEQKLMALRVNQRPAIRLRRQGADLYAGCGIFEQLPPQTEIQIVDRPTATMPFFKLFYPIDEIKSGMHHPDGMLWIRRPNVDHAIYSDKLPLTAIAPLILQMVTESTSTRNSAQPSRVP